MSSSDLPLMISEHWQVLEQLILLKRDIERNRWDGGVVVMLNNGQIEIRGLGVVSKPAQASGLLFAAFKTLPPAAQADMLSELTALMKRSEVIGAEAAMVNAFKEQK